MDVTLVDYMGSDDTVVSSARVSFDKEAHKFTNEQNTKLINYLAKHGHWSPFSHCFLQFRIKAPIFVARQLQKHTVGLAWNEISRRYVDFEPEFYVPKEWRSRPEGSVKQGSGSSSIETIQWYDKGKCEVDYTEPNQAYDKVIDHCFGLYVDMLEGGISPEMARMVLPQSMYTEWYWSGSLYAFARVCNQRLDSTAQKESGEIAKGIAKECEELFPVSWKALTNNS